VIVLFTLKTLAHLGRHLAPHLVRRVFADVRDDDRHLAGLDLLSALQNHFEEQRVDVVGAGQKDVFLRPALSATAYELVAVLKIVVAVDGLRDVIARV
jgi:hypothetical protein